MASNLLSNPQYWRDRAEEIRVLAERRIHAETKRMLETFVADYELWRCGRRNDFASRRRAAARPLTFDYAFNFRANQPEVARVVLSNGERG